MDSKFLKGCKISLLGLPIAENLSLKKSIASLGGEIDISFTTEVLRLSLNLMCLNNLLNQ